MAGIYIHIPFCKQRCNYCSFYSTTLYNIKEQYADAVCKELEVRKEYAGYEEIKTIYFGGGTPSTLPIALLQKICNAIYANHLVSNEAEVTIECNPDDLNKDYIEIECILEKFLNLILISMVIIFAVVNKTPITSSVTKFMFLPCSFLIIDEF